MEEEKRIATNFINKLIWEWQVIRNQIEWCVIDERHQEIEVGCQKSLFLQETSWTEI